MLKLENTETYGWEAAIRGMRNPKNSWDRSDSGLTLDSTEVAPGLTLEHPEVIYKIGPNDHKLMMQLASGGPVHAKFRRMIVVTVDITAPLYWWKEFDTYKVGTVANSCSTMHKIAAKEFTREDFSCEHLIDSNVTGKDTDCWIDPSGCLIMEPIEILDLTIQMLNKARKLYLWYSEMAQTGDIFAKNHVKDYWWQMIQLLPSSYNQRRTIMFNYEVLAGIYPMRKDHKLDEWHTFCDWIKDLPYSELIIGERKDFSAPENIWYDIKERKIIPTIALDYEVNVGNGRCNGSVLVPEGATDDEIRLAIMDDLYDVNYHPQEESQT